MPEYSTPKLTPAETTKLPGMNGSSSGYVLTSELLDIIRSTYGQANGVASLDSSGKLPTAQLPDIADDVLVYASKALLPAQGVEAKIYITTDDNVLYRWDATLADYVQLSVDLSDYATLDDLAAEESARESADTNLNNAINQLDHRVQNIEQSKGDYIVSAYKDGSTTPSGKGKWCVVEGVEGVSRVENMLFKTSASGSGGGIGYTNNNGLITLSGESTSTYTGFFDTMPILINHSYLIFFADVVNPNSLSFQVGSLNSTVKSYIGVPKVTTALIDLTASGMGLESYTSGTNFNGISFRFFIRDLNIHFGTMDLSFLGANDSAKLATIQKDYPHLLLPSDYGTRIVDWTGNGVRAWSRNIFDKSVAVANERWNGSVTSASSGTTRSALMRVKPSTAYYFKNIRSASVMTPIYWFDINQNYISSDSLVGTEPVSGAKTSPSNACYLGINLPSSALDTCCVNISDSNDGTFTPYFVNTLSFPSISLKSAGSVREKYLLAEGEKTNPLGSYTFTGNETWNTYGHCRYTMAISSLIKKSASPSDVGNVLCAGLVPTDVNNLRDNGATLSGIAVGIDGAVAIGEIDHANIASLTGKTLYYELATPNPDTYSDPILDNTLLTESGGRMATVQTGTVVDGIADLGFITL